MEDVTKLQAEKDALVVENNCLKEVIASDRAKIENLSAHIQAYQQTVNEVISGNISLKAGCSKLEKTIGQLQNDCSQKDAQLKSKDSELSGLKDKVQELENQIPAKKSKAS